jgi:chloramphenicol O-acetyltransferase
MKWPLVDRPIPERDLPLYNRFYLHASKASPVDPTLVWGTEVDADALQSFLRERNHGGSVVITTAHALIRATALAIAQFPEMNVRLVGHRVYAYRDVRIRMGFLHHRNREIGLLIVERANLKSLEEIAQEVWHKLLEAARGTGTRDRDVARFRRASGFLLRQMLRVHGFLDRHFRLPVLGRLDELRSASAMVNDLSFSGAPPMRSYKPTRFPDQSDSLNLTLGPMESKVVARGDQFVSTTVMPLFLRADHRLVDAYQVGRFLALVRDLLSHPERLDAPAEPPAPGAGSAPITRP